MAETEAGWRSDPSGRHEYRYWDGTRFTEHVADAGRASVDFDQSPASAAASAGPVTSIEVGFGSIGRQSRWTVFFRLILAIPALLWLALLSIAAVAVLVIAWFAALFTGRLPSGMAPFLTQVLRYGTRVNSYLWLLTDRYPPFALDSVDHPVDVEVPPPGPLNRLAVLFRLVLAIPAHVVVSLVSGGLMLAGVVIWLIVLVGGRMPVSLSEAVAAVVRYQARFSGYLMLLTSRYPGGLLGDRPEPAAAPVPPAGMAAPDGPGGTDGPELATPPAPLAPPRTARLVLSRSAKRLVWLFLVLGLVSNAANWTISVRLTDRVDAHNDLVHAYNDLSRASLDYGARGSRCASSTPCLTDAAERFLVATDRYAREVRDIDFPDFVDPEVRTLRFRIAEFRSAVAAAADASSASEFNAAAGDLASLAFDVDRATLRVLDELN